MLDTAYPDDLGYECSCEECDCKEMVEIEGDICGPCFFGSHYEE